MKNKWVYILLLILLGTSCQHDTELPPIRLVECAAMPSPVAAGSSFTYQDAIYLFGGRTEQEQYTNCLWQYDIAADQWTLLSKSPMKARVSSSACVVGDCAYIGLGFLGKVQRDTSYLSDFWEYNFTTCKWKRLADFPANTTVKNCLFATDDAIYAAYGFYREFTQDIYRYDIIHNKWELLDIASSPNVPRAMDIVGTSCQDRYFIGTGFNHGSLRFWAEWLPEEQQLVARKKILGPGRNAAACCATDEHIYLVGGRHYGDTLTTGFLFSSIQRYSPASDRWEYVGSMPYEAENMVAASIQGEVFIGLGEMANGEIRNNWYRIEE